MEGKHATRPLPKACLDTPTYAIFASPWRRCHNQANPVTNPPKKWLIRSLVREETKGRFRKKGGFGECALVPVLVPLEQMYPRSGFGSGEHLPEPPFWKPLFCEPPNLVRENRVLYLLFKYR